MRSGSAVQTKVFGIGICLFHEAVDGDLEIEDRAEHPAFEASPRELGEEAFDRIEPRGRCWREVEGPARMAGESGANLRMLVGGVVVNDSVDQLAGRDLRLHGIEETDELLMAVALHVAADDGAIEHD
jgi:hypothetical protein